MAGVPVATRLASAASAVFPLVAGPVQTGRVIGAMNQAVIIEVTSPDGPKVLSLLAKSAAGVPNGIRLSDVVEFDGVGMDIAVRVGSGLVRYEGTTVRVVRRWDSRVRPIVLDDAGVRDVRAALRTAPVGFSAGRFVDFADALLTEAAHVWPTPWPGPRTRQAIRGLIGEGTGLTPAGDDLLAGVLVALHASGRADLAAAMGATVTAPAPARERTTVFSADLLRLAVQGHACIEMLAVLRALHASGTAATSAAAATTTECAVSAATARLLSIGHTSGADLATGLTLGVGFAPSTAGRATAPPAQEVGRQ